MGVSQTSDPSLGYLSAPLCHFYFNCFYLMDPDCLEVPVARGVQEVLQALQRCFQECQGFQGCPVVLVGQEDQGDLEGLAQTSFSLNTGSRSISLQSSQKLTKCEASVYCEHFRLWKTFQEILPESMQQVAVQ